MKAITIRLPAVEAAMLIEVQQGNKYCKHINVYVISEMQREYERWLKARGR